MNKPANHYGNAPVLQHHEFLWIKDYLYKNAGIVLNESKQVMVMGRLEKRLRYYDLSSYTEYFKLFTKPGFENERVIAIDLLTTNETYFFREPAHFDFFTGSILPQYSSYRSFRVWSAASSSGEEAYTLAMLLAEYGRGMQWEILGTDISTRILDKAKRGLYPSQASEKIPPDLLKKYCLKGTGEYDGFLLIDPALRRNVKFDYANLIGNLPDLGRFEVIFLRNVMIYFDIETKQRLLERILKSLQPGGYFFVSHSESLNGLNTELQLIRPSIYRKPEKF
ncbi:CheR family methyltransferase [Methylomonas sp. MED-D]|uniref:Chemotaxis protein methyltransferase n=1 Tax=Methylomonas koyamae TaxID=702114 RepID=A0A177N3P9_9GAMM|nr:MULTISPECIES: protein-glutamate O-methyltransferase CheR [Methylomonas]NJA04603.1 protein-glutamate O-methyltransferase CheR [Methylococcaceae bacterium WWC4]MDT4332916.1 protein-glutamate O-methyltransferase CheR [Methylomonas sp. MV1]OAI12627.1 SAM-dependent methyltransferase [Methylomonas koyamae]OHX35791.1 SAM-dependent methyltransferase [Methylomonas sp. LWB]WGS86000.1 protein-glutamate O-methyltransferase CheR [Methylomonas sp. UP202]